MTDYFDTAERDLRERIARVAGDGVVVEIAALTEGCVVREVLLCTGDREFPDDLREKILNCIVKRAIVDFSGNLRTGNARNEDAEDYLVTVRASDLLGELHSLFHELARRRLPTRFGPWSDSPRGNLYRRDAHDSEAQP